MNSVAIVSRSIDEGKGIIIIIIIIIFLIILKHVHLHIMLRHTTCNYLIDYLIFDSLINQIKFKKLLLSYYTLVVHVSVPWQTVFTLSRPPQPPITKTLVDDKTATAV